MVASVLSRQPQHTLFKGRVGAGVCILPSGVKGETVLGIINIGTGSTESGNFEITISATGQIQQTSTKDLSANEYYAVTFG
jgi:hypothetical protein